ncbi:MAG TPA: CorA family divalent cation transporter [Steroidobacteraceae bacterium]|jgi:zinc transporter|nr:CorA family divalent cation transporter [Steroidobacteraceae bacterium]
MPLFLSEGAGADRGLICGYSLQSHGPAREVTADGIVEALAQADQVTWLHFNLSDQRARRWLLNAAFVPPALREVLQEHDENRRVEWTDGGLLMVISDFTYEDESDPSEVAPLWCCASRNLLITGRVHALKSADELRLRMRSGVTAGSGIELAAHLFDIRTARIKLLADTMTRQLDDIEDEILAGNIKQQREQLGRSRRLCARLRREFAPERGDLGRLLHRSAQPMPEAGRNMLASSVEQLAFAIEEIAEIYERAKLLQEELASRLAENTGRNLYVLSILTAVLLPMTLVTGVYGMNVAHLPGATSFPLVLLLILASGGVTLALLFWRRLL